MDAGGNILHIENRGDFTAATAQSVGDNANAIGISARTVGANNDLRIENHGDFTVAATNTYYSGSANAYGISASSDGGGSELRIENRGDLTVTGTGPGGKAGMRVAW